MKRVPPRSLAFAALVLPLAVLALFGSAELGRQTERAERALTDQARDFLSDTQRAIDAELQRVDRLLAVVPDLTRLRAAAATRILRDEDDSVLDVLVVDADGRLLFPRASPREIDSLPFQRPSSVAAIRRAEALELLGDAEGARNLLIEAIERLPQERLRSSARSDAVLRAHFALGGLLRRGGELERAEEHYLIASVEALAGARRDTNGAAERSTVALWSEMALAELDITNGRGTGRAVELAREIADGVHDAIAEPMLQAVLGELAEVCRDDPGAADEFLDVRDADATRQAGRLFATEYGPFLRESVRRRIAREPTGESIVRIVHAFGGGASLLVMRPATQLERAATIDEFDGTAWIGVRADLDHLLADALADRLAAGSRPFALAVSDAEGTAIALPLEVDAPNDLDPPAELTTRAGLRISAFPIDPDGLMAERRRTVQNRALLVLLLCAAAGGGALLLVRSVARESELANLKIALVSRVTHDLKTPLALIRMYAETIHRGRARTPEETARFAGIVEREADVLTRMVERILDFSRKESGTLTYRHRTVDLTASLATVADAYRPHAQSRGLSLRTELPDRAITAQVDPGAFESAVLDLLENAVKYSNRDADGAEIVLGLTAAGHDAVIEVRDRGCGIPEPERERVFESFHRGSNAGEVRGSGLGLSLVRHFARSHGGDVSALGRDGPGTTMRLTLPRIDRGDEERVDSVAGKP